MNSVNIDLSKFQNHQCFICGDILDFSLPKNHEFQPSIDHVNPKANNGTNNLYNRVIVHRQCNSIKGKKINVELLEKLSELNVQRKEYIDSFLNNIDKSSMVYGNIPCGISLYNQLREKNDLRLSKKINKIYQKYILGLNEIKLLSFSREKLMSFWLNDFIEKANTINDEKIRSYFKNVLLTHHKIAKKKKHK